MPNRSIAADHTWWASHWRTVLGAVFFIVGFAATAYMAYSSSRTTPPTSTESVLLVLVAGLFQLSSIYLFSQSGRADPVHARSAVRRLTDYSQRAKIARLAADNSYELQTPQDAKRTMRLIATELGYLEEGINGAIDDWTEFNIDARRRVVALRNDLAVAGIETVATELRGDSNAPS